MFQNGLKGSKMVNLTVFDHLGPYLAHLDHFGPFQTKVIFFAPSRVGPRWSGAKKTFLSETVLMGPNEPKRISVKTVILISWALLDHFVPLWNIDKPAMFDHFWSKIGHFWTTPVYLIVKKKVHHQLYPVFCKSQRFRYDLISFDSCKQQQLLSSPLILFHPFRSQRKCADSWGPPSNLAKIRRVQVNVMMIPDM